MRGRPHSNTPSSPTSARYLAFFRKPSVQVSAWPRLTQRVHGRWSSQVRCARWHARHARRVFARGSSPSAALRLPGRRRGCFGVPRPCALPPEVSPPSSASSGSSSSYLIGGTRSVVFIARRPSRWQRLARKDGTEPASGHGTHAPREREPSELGQKGLFKCVNVDKK